MQKKKILIICGPTASGKTHLGHRLAKLYNGAIINSDAMQIYQQIPIITASPLAIYRQEIPYHLYNFLSISQEFSVVKYLNTAFEIIKEIADRDQLPIIIGGTGLYINSLLFGYNEIPEISPEIRQYVRALHTHIGQVEFFQKLQQLDVVSGQKLHSSDRQRSIRSYEVYMQTGRSIFEFHTAKNARSAALAKFNVQVLLLHPERNFLYQSCNERVETLFNNGAIEEVKAVAQDFPNLTTAGTKAIGVQEILAYLTNTVTLSEALTLTQTKTRQYAKRQLTWFRNQIQDKTTFEYSSNLQFEELLNSFNNSEELLKLDS
ncbi:tRNA (adenosine(37)-N6)-dimethylallyltransferase MiaA [Candidatus Tisiphia endosymbiont of Nemotelus uliginosus]|uniref:tRNA (adenosine(37)-N6)-dimethylallyltransferase MiaA n=1 Tax=Candidatus Tisiphia endosymbiont of Nemotelus uliginosus TaxID=3077926 RepID=UPI0035C89651